MKGGSNTHGLIDYNRFTGTAFGILLYGNGAADWASPLPLIPTRCTSRATPLTRHWLAWYAQMAVTTFRLDEISSTTTAPQNPPTPRTATLTRSDRRFSRMVLKRT